MGSYAGFAPIRAVVLRVSATGRTIAEAQRDNILAEKRRSADYAPLPADFPNHAGRVVVSIQHRFAFYTAVIGPAFRLDEAIRITAMVRCSF